MLPVVISSYVDSPWLDNCMKAIRATTRRKPSIHVGLVGAGYEPAALAWACDQFDRFLFLQDSVTVLSRAFWKTVDTHSTDAWLADRPSMCMGIFTTNQIRPLLPNEPVNKSGSIQFENAIHDHLTMPTLWPGVNDATALRFEYRHGRNNLVLGADGIWEKHKGNWGQ